MMWIITRFAFHEMWFSLKINISFYLMAIMFLLLCCFLFFDDVSTIVNRFKLGIVYQRRHPLPLSTSEPTFDPVLQEPR